MSAAQIGRKNGPHSAETRAKISAAHLGKKASREARASMSAAQMGNQNTLGFVPTAATRAKLSALHKAKWADGRMHVQPIGNRYTKLARALHGHLATQGLTLEPEVRFGRFTVDLYDRAHHIAYEADGSYWHDRAEARTPGCHANRDAYLIQYFGLKVVHFTDKEIKALTRLKREASA